MLQQPAALNAGSHGSFAPLWPDWGEGPICQITASLLINIHCLVRLSYRGLLCQMLFRFVLFRSVSFRLVPSRFSCIPPKPKAHCMISSEA